MTVNRLALLVGFAWGCGSDAASMPRDAPPGDAPIDTAAPIDAAPRFTLEATDLDPQTGSFTDAQLAGAFGCTGSNASPALRWSNPPVGTKGFVLTLYDPDAPTGSGFWHWTLFNIPATTTSLVANAAAAFATLPPGSAQGYVDFGRPGYGGPCPPLNDPVHRYTFLLTAVSVSQLPGVSENSPGALVAGVAHSVSIGTAVLRVPFGRSPGNLKHPETPENFTLSSTDVSASAPFTAPFLLDSFGCTGNNFSPQLQWSGAPANTLSYALTLYDPDASTPYDPDVATGSGFWHWLAFDIQPNVTTLAQRASAPDGNPALSLGGGVQAKNDLGTNQYAGPCPPVGDTPHRYVFTVYALPVAHLGLTQEDTGGRVGGSLRAMATGKASFTVPFARTAP